MEAAGAPMVTCVRLKLRPSVFTTFSPEKKGDGYPGKPADESPCLPGTTFAHYQLPLYLPQVLLILFKIQLKMRYRA
jgi:hypothetical protein